MDTVKYVRYYCRSEFLYQDTIVYDMIEMDECHVLLDRHWPFDRDTSHKERKTLIPLYGKHLL